MEYEKPSLFQRIFCNKKMLSVHINNFISRYNIFSFATQSVLSKDQKYHHLKLARNADSRLSPQTNFVGNSGDEAQLFVL